MTLRFSLDPIVVAELRHHNDPEIALCVMEGETFTHSCRAD